MEDNIKNEDLSLMADDDLFQDADDLFIPDGLSELVVYSRDWTIQTIFDQIEQGNIELNPGFQRRNAWNDSKRSALIESLLIGYPIPEIVLAEDKKKKKAFIVIDGKQRLLTIAGFINNEKYKYWRMKNPKLASNKIARNSDSIDYRTIKDDTELKRIFENSSLRCTVISNYSSEDELYDIFYRLNAGSTPLATQELRQALYRGNFANFLIEITNKPNVIRDVMGLNEADKRLRDVEVILRCMAFMKYAKSYKGNLLRFLDKVMEIWNNDWDDKEIVIRQCWDELINTTSLLGDVFGGTNVVGRKYKNGELERRFNRVLFEVEVFYFSKLLTGSFTKEQHHLFINLFKELCENDSQFMSSLEGSTKNSENYKIRYAKFQEIINKAYEVNLDISPF